MEQFGKLNNSACQITNRSYSYSYRTLKCRCKDCKYYHNEQRYRDKNAKERARLWRLKYPERSRENSKKYQREHPDQLFKWQLKKYNLTLEEYKQLEIEQNNRCAICLNGVSGMSHSNKRLSIDHDHLTGKVRGLLCGNCNVGIGHLKHNPILLQNSITYLTGDLKWLKH